MNIKLKYHPLLVFILFLFCSETGNTQDLHFSQYYHALQNINPALTGVMEADYRISSLYRSQWESVPVSFLTYLGAFDMKYYLPGHRDGFFGGGLVFNYDQAGDARWRLAQLGLSLSYSRALNDDNILSAGFQLSRSQRSFDVNALQFANQYNGEVFDPNRATGEGNLQDQGFSYSDFGAGVNWNFKVDGRVGGTSSGNMGLGIYHLNRPQMGLYPGSATRLPFRFTVYIYGWTSFPDWDKVDFFFSAYGQLMGTSNEATAGGDVRYHLPQQNGKKIALSLGLHYRYIGLNDALFPVLKVFYQDWTVGFSYDINLSPFNVATNGRGGPEISAIYTITKVKALKEFRACPIF